MAHQIDYIDYLANEVGPHPAGTEEEQQAALFIADTFQTETGFPTEIEDVVSSSNIEPIKPICALVTVVVGLLAIILPQFMLPAMLISLIAGVFYVLETIGRPVLTKALSKGASQNVVAKYIPSNSGTGRKRRIVLVAHYDTGKATPALVSKFESMGVPWSLVCTIAMIFVPAFLLLRVLFFGGAAGVGVIILNILTLVGVILAALPVVRAVLLRLAPLSDGANDNASGVSALLEVAKKISKGMMNEEQIENSSTRARIHGERAAAESGFVPEGADLQYQVSETDEIPEEDRSPEQRLSAAKAAIAALTGEAVSTTAYVKNAESYSNAVISDGIRITEIPNSDFVNNEAYQAGMVAEVSASGSGEDIYGQASENTSDAAQFIQEETEPVDENVPDWFAAAQRKAKRSPQRPKPAQRSRYADALDAAINESTAIFNEANKLVINEGEDRMRARSADIVEVAPPALAGQAVAASAEVVSRVAYAPITTSLSDVSKQQANAVVEEPVVEQFVAEQPTSEPVVESAPAVEAEQVREPDVEVFDEKTRAFAPIIMTPEEIADISANADGAAPVVEKSSRDLNLPSFSDQPIPEPVDIDLPDFAAQGQRAPLAETSHTASSRALASSIPAIVGPGMAVPEQTVPSKSGAMRALRTKLPSLSGSFERIGDQDVAVSNVSSVGSFGAAGATGAIEPVGDELLSGIDPEDAYIEDADDSDVEDYYTETGAFTGPDYVEMPKSRVRGFFDKFRRGSKKARNDEETPQEWLDVEDDFDPRAVGKERGGWDSFRDEDIESRRDRGNSSDFANEDDYSAEYDDYAEDSYDDYVDPYTDTYEDSYNDSSWGSNRRWQGGAMSRMSLGRVNMRSSSKGDSEDVAAALDENIETSAEVNAVYQFRNPNFETEIWFVALGSEVDRHDGIRAFINAHHNELNGATIIDLEAIGAGTLSYAQVEGALGGKETSSRIKRFVQKAYRESGIPCETVRMPGIESAASIAAASGMQSMHLLGIEAGAKALSGQGEDVFDNIDPQRLEENTYFVEELIKSI